MKKIIIILIKFYKLAVSPYLPSACRFYPTCSEYALEAVKTHGTIKGGLLAVKRIFRCHPFNKGGYDPVPCKHEHHQDLSVIPAKPAVALGIKQHYEIM